jgi:hypothetical protein
MATVTDTSTVNPSDQPIGKPIGAGESVQNEGGGPPADETHGHAAGDGEILVGPANLSVARVAKRRHQITARRPAGEVVAVDTIELARAGQRQRFIEQVLEKLGLPEADAKSLETELDKALLQLASAPATTPASGHAAATEAEFCVVADVSDPELNGIYSTTPPARVANFDLRILEHIVVEDEDRTETRLRLVIRRRGRQREFEMTAADFASNGKLRTAIYSSALPAADLKAGADVLRRAVIALSAPAIRRTTISVGWVADHTRFLVPGGFVDADGTTTTTRPSTSLRSTGAGPMARSGWRCAASPPSSSSRSSATSSTSCAGSTSRASCTRSWAPRSWRRSANSPRPSRDR